MLVRVSFLWALYDGTVIVEWKHLNVQARMYYHESHVDELMCADVCWWSHALLTSVLKRVQCTQDSDTSTSSSLFFHCLTIIVFYIMWNCCYCVSCHASLLVSAMIIWISYISIVTYMLYRYNIVLCWNIVLRWHVHRCLICSWYKLLLTS